jgi:hypothetical protein
MQFTASPSPRMLDLIGPSFTLNIPDFARLVIAICEIQLFRVPGLRDTAPTFPRHPETNNYLVS